MSTWSDLDAGGHPSSGWTRPGRNNAAAKVKSVAEWDCHSTASIHIWCEIKVAIVGMDGWMDQGYTICAISWG